MKALFISLLLALSLRTLAVTEWIVATNGHDTAATAGTLDDPFLSPNYGKSRMARGDILSIRAGTYYTKYLWCDDKPGLDASHYTILRGHPGDPKPVIRVTNTQGGGLGGNDACRYVIWSGLRVDQDQNAGDGLSCFKFQGSSFNIITNCELVNSFTHGILMTPGNSGDTRNCLVTHCLITNWGVGWIPNAGRSWPHGIYNEGVSNIFEYNDIHHGNPLTGSQPSGIKNGQGTASRNIIRYNVIHDVQDGVTFVEGVGNLGYGNVIYNFTRMGWWIYNSASSCVVANNTIFNGYNGIVSQRAGPGNLVANNIVFHMQEFGLYNGTPHDGGSTAWTNNLAYDVKANDFTPGVGGKSGNLLHSRPAASPVDARFVSMDKAHLLPPPLQVLAGLDVRISANSSARDAGIDLSSWFTRDPDGNAYGQGAGWDIGAYEHVGSVK